MMPARNPFHVAIAVAVLLVAVGCGAGVDTPPSISRTAGPGQSMCLSGSVRPTVIHIGMPESVTGRSRQRGVPLPELSAWLSARIGIPVDFVPIREYRTFTEGLVDGQLHGALIPPAEFVQARKRLPCLRLTASTVYRTSIYYMADIIVHRDSTIRTVPGLRGSRIAFSSPRSASGYIYVARYLAGFGLLPWRDYEPVFTGSHRETIEAVRQKTVDAGATFTDAIRIAATGESDLSDIGILAVAGRIPSEPLVLSPDLDSELARRIANAFLEVSANNGVQGLLGPRDLMSGWVETDEAVYAEVAQAIAEVDSLGGPEVAE